MERAEGLHHLPPAGVLRRRPRRRTCLRWIFAGRGRNLATAATTPNARLVRAITIYEFNDSGIFSVKYILSQDLIFHAITIGKKMSALK